MAKLVVCLDGTWQVRAQGSPVTNIVRLFDALGGTHTNGDWGSVETSVAGPNPVQGKYLPGVGSQGTQALKYLGGAFGAGIGEQIVRGYTFLSRHYRAGDEIFLTGFSRGATAARALAGLIVVRGLLNPAKYDPANKEAAHVRGILAWYAYRAADTALADQNRPALLRRLIGEDLPKLTAGDFVPPAQVKAVGVFDTVSSLGVPRFDPTAGVVFDFTICDTTLNPRVLHGFHALAADEVRDVFAPTFWAERANIEQRIFAGDHGDVGGGHGDRGLSDGSLDWVMGKLIGAGAPLDPARVSGGIRPKALAKAHDPTAEAWMSLQPTRNRVFPRIALPHDLLRARKGKSVETIPGLFPSKYAPRGKYTDGGPIV